MFPSSLISSTAICEVTVELPRPGMSPSSWSSMTHFIMLCFSKNVFSGLTGALEADTAAGVGCCTEGEGNSSAAATGYWWAMKGMLGEGGTVTWLTSSVLRGREAPELTSRKFSEDHRGLGSLETVMLLGARVVLTVELLWCESFTGAGGEDFLLSENSAGSSMDLRKWLTQSDCSWGRLVHAVFVIFVRDMAGLCNHQHSISNCPVKLIL